MWALPPFRRWLLTCHDRVGDEVFYVRPHTSPSAVLTGASRRLGGDFSISLSMSLYLLHFTCHFIKLCLLGCTLIVSNYCFFHTVGFTLISASMPLPDHLYRCVVHSVAHVVLSLSLASPAGTGESVSRWNSRTGVRLSAVKRLSQGSPLKCGNLETCGRCLRPAIGS